MQKQPSPSNLVIYGPQGCGKSFYAETLMQHYGLERIQDEWDGMSPVPHGTLALTNVHPPYTVEVAVMLPFDQTPAASARKPYELPETEPRQPCAECGQGSHWIRPPYAKESISCKCLVSAMRAEKSASNTASPPSGHRLSRIFKAVLNRS